MNRRVIIGAAAALVLVLGVGWYLWRQHGADNPDAPFSLSGNVDVHQVELAFRVTGRIADMKAQEGDKVAAGAPWRSAPPTSRTRASPCNVSRRWWPRALLPTSRSTTPRRAYA